MNTAHQIKAVVIVILSLIKMVSAMEDDSIKFTAASLECLRIRDGSRITDDLENHGWKWIQKKGDTGVLTSAPSKGKKSEILLMMTAGLEPGRTYEVFGYFRTSGNEPIQPDKRTCRPVQLGVTLARLQTFDGIKPQISGMVRSWMVTPGSDVGKFFGFNAEIQNDPPLAGHAVASGDTAETLRLVKARLGYSKASKDGTLPVYFADYPYQDMGGTASIEGVGVRAVQNNVPIEEGWKSGTRLHLAIRSNDTFTIHRELEAKADLNLLDENGVTPLFYASASENRELVKAMLDAGANPNRASQFISPLSAAAIQSDVPMAKLLLDGGAEIPLKTLPLSEKASRQIDPAFLHPLVVAIRARSLPMVRLLYEKNPAIDLQKILPLDLKQFPSDGSPSPPYPHFIEYASSHDDWEMVEYLLSKGVKMQDDAMPGFTRRKPFKMTLAESVLMSRAAAAKANSVATLDRFLLGWIDLMDPISEGVNPNKPRTEPVEWISDSSENDMLQAAISYGNLDLADQLMRHARRAGYNYQDSLLSVAYTSRNPKAISLVKSHFPEARMRRWNPAAPNQSVEREIIAEDARTFLPRTSPYTPKKLNESRRYVLAVISSREGGDAAAALATAASSLKEWSVVDRDTSASLLQEMKIGSPWQKGNHDVTAFGDRLAADVIVLVDRASQGESPLYSYEAIEVATGLVFHRAHIPAELINDPNRLGSLLADFRRQTLSCQQNARREAVTLLGFASPDDIPQQTAVEKLFKARVQYEVDSTPGMISLTRRQTSRIIEEQAMNGKNSIWAASHLVEGGLTPLPDGRVKVTLRLETIRAEKTAIRDASAVGDLSKISELISRAWHELNESGRARSASGAPAPTSADETAARRESERMIEEIRWMYANGMPPSLIEPYIMAAMALGLSEDVGCTLHLGCLYLKLHACQGSYVGWGYSDGFPTDEKYSIKTQKFSLSSSEILVRSDRLALRLDDMKELLDQACFYKARHESGFLRNDSVSVKVQLEVLQALLAIWDIRTMIYEDSIPDGKKASFKEFYERIENATGDFLKMVLKIECGISEGRAGTCGRQRLEINEQLRYYASGNHLSLSPSLYSYVVGDICDLKLKESIFDLGWPQSGWRNRSWIPACDPGLAIRIKNAALGKAGELYGQESWNARLLKAYLHTRLCDGVEERRNVLSYISLANDPSGDGEVYLANYWNHCRDEVIKHNPTQWFGHRWQISKLSNWEPMIIPSLLHNSSDALDVRLMFDDYAMGGKSRLFLSEPFEKKTAYYTKHFQNQRRSAKELVEKAARDETWAVGNLVLQLNLLEMVIGITFLEDYDYDLDAIHQAKAARDAGVLGKRIFDTASLAGRNPGPILWPFLDDHKPSVLWFSYLESNDNAIPSEDVFTDWKFKRSLLVAFDLKTHQVLKTIDLHKNVSSAADDRTTQLISDKQGRLGQNQHKIMMNLGEFKERTVLVNKSDGTFVNLPEDARAETRENQYQIPDSIILGYESGFYFLNGNEMKYLDENMKVHGITSFQRKPALTPFDTLEREPLSLIRFGDRILVTGVKHAAFYNPGQNDWKEIKDLKSELGAAFFEGYPDPITHKSCYNTPNQIITSADGKKAWREDYWLQKNMCLRLRGKNNTYHDVPLDLPFSEDFLKSVFMLQAPKGELNHQYINRTGEKVVFSELIKSYRFYPFIVSQADDHLIIGLELGQPMPWYRVAKDGVNLPCLWRISKTDLLQKLNP